MKRPKLRKTSKRMTCSKKYRIRKNVAAHNRKVRKEAKKSKAQGKVKNKPKDPGVPNSVPFKEEILREAELRKQQAEEAKKRQKEQRHNEYNKRRSLEGLQSDAMQRQKAFEHQTTTIGKMVQDKYADIDKEMSRKAYYKEFKKVVESADVVVEVLDARDPLGCRCLEMEKTILESGTNKRIVLLLNKIDLVPKQNVEDWLKYLRNEFPTVAFKASTQSQKSNLTQCKVPLKLINAELLSTTSQCVGADSLLKLLSNYCRQHDVETSITVGVVGFPNVGKSSVINSLKRTKACNVGAMPGITKAMQEVTLNKNIKILDCPGIVMATGTNDTAVILRNCVKIESLDDPVTPVAAILSRCNKQQIMMRYNVVDYEDALEFLEQLAHRKGKLKKGGVPNIDFAAKSILQDWNSGKISYYTHPPQDKGNTHVDAKIVEKMTKEFDWNGLEKDNVKALNAVKGCPSESHSILFESSGPTSVGMDIAKDDDDDVEEQEHSDVEASNAMEDDEPHAQELGEIRIDLSKKARGKASISNATKKKKIAKLELEDIDTSGSNIQANRKVKELMKVNKKKRKRAEKISDKLGDSLLSAMDFSKGHDETEDYDFKTDFSL
ncbi:unnamed protein product [Clavelina lepadiformis]|uniref:CP-type G domain-containing protein n=1 Tax=Clavelina lepadiformis TaxID=159417 RepID=A0ABP0GFD2_CLALP